MPSRPYPVVPTQFTAYLNQLPDEGFTVTPADPDHGQVIGRGYTMNYAYDGVTLTITGVNKGFFSLPWESVFDLIGEHLT